MTATTKIRQRRRRHQGWAKTWALNSKTWNERRQRQPWRHQNLKIASQTNFDENRNKFVYYVSSRFKHHSSEFSRAVDECWDEFLSNLKKAALDVNLSNHQYLQYLHILLRGNAKPIYIKLIDSSVWSFTEASAILEKEYNSLFRQNCIAVYIRNLPIQKLVSYSSSLSDALEKIHEEISKLALQSPMY